jgi:hypothetical protein
LTYEYIQYSFQFYKAARKKLQKIFKTLEKENVQNIVFYGVSDLTEIAFISLQETSLQLVAVMDDIKIGERFLSFGIADPAKIISFIFDKVVITDMEQRETILDRFRARGITRDKIVVFD